jgi:hypothetical protein
VSEKASERYQSNAFKSVAKLQRFKKNLQIRLPNNQCEKKNLFLFNSLYFRHPCRSELEPGNAEKRWKSRRRKINFMNTKLCLFTVITKQEERKNKLDILRCFRFFFFPIPTVDNKRARKTRTGVIVFMQIRSSFSLPIPLPSFKFHLVLFVSFFHSKSINYTPASREN